MSWIAKVIPELPRAPPKITFERGVVENSGITYAGPEDATATNDADFNQTVQENNDDFNQDNGW